MSDRISFLCSDSLSGDNSQPVGPRTDPIQNLLEGWLVAVVEGAAIYIRLVVEPARFRHAQNEGFIFRDIRIVALTESLGLVLPIRIRADEGLNLRALEQGIDVVVVTRLYTLRGVRGSPFSLRTRWSADVLEAWEGLAHCKYSRRRSEERDEIPKIPMPFFGRSAEWNTKS